MMMIPIAKLRIKVFGKGTRITELINHFTVKGPLSLGPIAPIELSIVDGLGQMGHGDAVATGQVGDGTGHLEDSAVSSGRQRQLSMAPRGNLTPAGSGSGYRGIMRSGILAVQ